MYAENVLETSRREGRQEGRIEGRQEGKQDGKQEEKYEVIIVGHKNGLSIAMLAKLARLPEEEVIKILKNEGLIS